MQFADHSNQYIDFHKPWSMAKSEDINIQNQVQEICTVALNDFKLMSLYLKPVLPKIAQDIEYFLNIPELKWEDNKNILFNHYINSFKPLLNRIKIEDIEKFMKI